MRAADEIHDDSRRVISFDVLSFSLVGGERKAKKKSSFFLFISLLNKSEYRVPIFPEAFSHHRESVLGLLKRAAECNLRNSLSSSQFRRKYFGIGSPLPPRTFGTLGTFFLCIFALFCCCTIRSLRRRAFLAKFRLKRPWKICRKVPLWRRMGPDFKRTHTHISSQTQNSLMREKKRDKKVGERFREKHFPIWEKIGLLSMSLFLIFLVFWPSVFIESRFVSSWAGAAKVRRREKDFAKPRSTGVGSGPGSPRKTTLRSWTTIQSWTRLPWRTRMRKMQTTKKPTKEIRPRLKKETCFSYSVYSPSPFFSILKVFFGKVYAFFMGAGGPPGKKMATTLLRGW